MSNIVIKGVNFSWLQSLVSSAEDKEKLHYLQQLHKNATQGEFSKDNDLFSIHLGSHTLWFRNFDAWYSIEVFTEIFKENDHFLLKEFHGENIRNVIDVGANVGYYSLKLKDYNPECRILAVEPNPYCSELLRKNLQANQISNVEAIEMAVAPVTGNLDFQIIREAGVLGSKYLSTLKRETRPWLKNTMIQTIDVRSITLDKLMKDYSMDTVDILKMDVEDMELEIMESSKDIFPYVKRMVIQWHRLETKKELIKLLTTHNFELVLEEAREYGDLYFVNKSG